MVERPTRWKLACGALVVSLAWAGCSEDELNADVRAAPGAASSPFPAQGQSPVPATPVPGAAPPGTAAETPAGTEPPPPAQPEPIMDPAPRVEVELALSALAAHTTVGLEWNAVEGATGYRLYVSSAPGVDVDAIAPIEVDGVTYVHRGLSDGVPQHYAVTALLPEGESVPSPEVAATPGGEWVLELFGSGSFDDVLTGEHGPRVPVEQRVHVLLFAEGYTASELSVLHDLASHDGGRGNDVDRWVDEVLSLEPYSFFREAFVVWFLPRPSNETIGGNTAFAVPADASASFAQTLSIPNDGETATRAWQAIAAHPVPPTDTGSGFRRSARNHIAYFLMFDPARGRASVSGRATSLTDPESGMRISSAFGIPFAHEFTHSFSGLNDEYLDHERQAPQYWDETSNVVPTNLCSELPWRHLLAGSAINPDVDQLVGAFGREGLGYHPELVCLLNGMHDNAEFYGGSGSLRNDERMCNFCREITAYRVFERTTVLGGDAAFDSWVADYRAAFYDRFGFVVPAVVPQTNDVRNPSAGDPIYEACMP